MHFAIICKDKTGAAALRQANRPEHLAYLESAGATLELAGPLMDDDGQSIGSLIVVNMADRAAAEAFAEGDPFKQAGVFADVTVRPFRAVLGRWTRTDG